jgi:hypothetical protein
MSPENFVEDFDPLFVRPCIFPILASLGYDTSVSINNGLTSSQSSCDMQLSLSILSEVGSLLGHRKLEILSPGQVTSVNTDLEMKKMGISPEGNMIGVIHSVPLEFKELNSVTIDRRFMNEHVSASDDFIEFRQKTTGVITGVAYQMGPQNDYRFNRTRSTLIQAPKIIVSDKVDTLFAIINASTKFSYRDIAHLEFRIIGESGELICQDYIDVQPWSFQLLSISSILEKHDLFRYFLNQGGRGLFLGLSQDCGLVPISLTRNSSTGALACDHTLPPVYYFSNWGGKMRIDANAKLHSLVFSQEKSN